jgi:hypothetical protein
MRILIYLAHPAQYHFFKNIMKRLAEKGHEIKLLLKTKDILETLVSEEGWPYENILPESRGSSFLSILGSMLFRDILMLKQVRRFRPDLLLGSDSSVAHAGFLTGRKAITFGEDDYAVIRKLAWMMIPFSYRFLSPEACSVGPFKYKKVPYNGYMKLAYLHPAVFRPDKSKISNWANSPYVIIRRARLSAHHDKRIAGLSPELVITLTGLLEKKNFRVYLDAEDELPENLEKYRLTLPKNDFHHLLAFASFIISDSQSMSMEAAMLGIPSIRFNDFAGRIGVLEELEHRYRLTYGIPPSRPDLLFSRLEEWTDNPRLQEEFSRKREIMLAEKINVLDFMVRYIEQFS